MNIYVGNLPYKFSEEDLRSKFGEFGEVLSVSLIKDKETGRSKGYAFVEMPDAAAEAAIKALESWSSEGRQVKVNPAKPREDKKFSSRRPPSRSRM